MDEAAPDRTLVRDASDHSLLVSFGDEISGGAHARVRRLFHALRREPPAWAVNLHPAYASLLVSCDPRRPCPEDARAAVAETLARGGEERLPEPRVVEVPVCYGGEFGPDLGEVAAACGIAPDEVVREHAGGDYLVYFLGFSPGFPYLGGMAARIAAPRRASPRKRVPGGSVAIGGNQTGVYPTASPGGWQIIGRTPLALFDPRAAEPALLALGDRVRFLAIAEERFAELAPPEGGAASDVAAPSGQAIRVVEPGFQSTIQDLGRPGHAHLGVSASGAGDPVSLRIANWLVGNDGGAAAIEMTLTGGTFAFPAAAVVALTGSEFEPVVDGMRVPMWTALEIHQGQTLTCGATRSGARCYLAIRGGLVVDRVMGSLSTHLTTGLGGLEGRALRKGDPLAVAVPGREPAPLRRFAREAAGALLRRGVLRVTRGAQWDRFGEEAWGAMLASTYAVGEDSSRMGLRLRGATLTGRGQGSMLTEGVSLGALQVPPEGQPILSFVEHQTTGGYPQIACVIAADLHRVGQLRPRDEVRFEEISIAEAAALARTQEASLAEQTGAAR